MGIVAFLQPCDYAESRSWFVIGHPRCRDVPNDAIRETIALLSPCRAYSYEGRSQSDRWHHYAADPTEELAFVNMASPPGNIRIFQYSSGIQQICRICSACVLRGSARLPSFSCYCSQGGLSVMLSDCWPARKYCPLSSMARLHFLDSSHQSEAIRRRNGSF
jgi:hypothetical protein